jgi:PGAP1-like protein
MQMLRITLCIAIIAISIYSSFRYQLDPKHCDGNYIQPSYSNTGFKSKNSILNKRYTLVRHSEAGIDKSGIPVLFLAGNAGTYKQVRSLGSVCYRIWKWEFSTQLPLQLYTIDTREELTAFSTITLKDQAFFANEAVAWLLQSYPDDSRPKSVYIIGHSMAGVIARYMPTMDNYQPGSIENIFTLATPHKEAPVPLSRDITGFYSQLNMFWSLNHNNGSLKDIALVSIAGGTRDTTLDSTLTSLDGISDPKKTIGVFSSGVNGVWTSADHEGAVWCDQTLQTISKSIYTLDLLKSPTVEDRVQVLKALIEQEPNPSTVLEPVFIPITEILVHISENYITLPKLQNNKESTVFQLWWPPVNLRNLYRFRLITNLSENELELFSCDNQNHPLKHNCTSMKQDIKFIPSTRENFKLVFRSAESRPSENRKRWMTVDMPFTKAQSTHQFLVLKTKPGADGFLFADVMKSVDSSIISTSPFVRIFGIKTVFAPNSILTVAKFSQITDGLIKYRLYVTPLGGMLDS